MMADIFCTDCKRLTEIVFDHASGDTICSECGLVLESYSIDETTEWRNFTDDTADGHDPNRVGEAHNPLLGDVGLTTRITQNPKGKNKNAGDGGGPSLALVDRWVNGSTAAERNLVSGYSEISAMADRLDLANVIGDRAKVIFKKMADMQKTCRTRKYNQAMQGACLLVACQQVGTVIPLKHICSVLSKGAGKKDVMKAKNVILKCLREDGDEDGIAGKTIKAGDCVKRFCSYLGIENYKVIKAASEVVLKCEEEIDVRRSPLSVAAAVIYIVVQLCEEKEVRRGCKEIAAATGVAEGTIRYVFKDLYPHLAKIVPSWYAQGEVLNDVCHP